MKLQKMINAVADTEGEIFTTKSGSLRYVTDRKNPPVWIQGKKKLTLTAVPIEGTDREERRADQQLPAHLQRAGRVPRREARQPLRQSVGDGPLVVGPFSLTLSPLRGARGPGFRSRTCRTSRGP